jgi:STE24 endopeptidase
MMMSTRLMAAGVALAAVLAPAMASAAPHPPFDVETATHAYLALLQGPARAKSDAYFEGGYWLPLWGTLVAVAIYLLMLRSGLSARFRDVAERLAPWGWLVPAIYAVPFVIASTLLALPWTIWSGFVRERHYGLMSQSFPDWLGEQAIGLGVAIVVNALLLVALFAVIRRFRRTWWLWGAATTSAFLVFGLLLGPVFVAPLFNHYTELPAGPIRDRIVAMATASHIPAEHIYLFDASKQSKRISANVSGIGPTIRISLNDNLLNRTGPDEVAAVMGHEMGHYVIGHIERALLLISLALLGGFWIVQRIVPGILARFGARWGVRDVADPAVLPLLSLLAAVAGLILTPALNTLTRVQESQADAFGLNVAREPDGFAKVAMRLSEYRKIEPGPIEEMLFFDHPSGATRVRMAMQWKKDHVPGATMSTPDIKLDGQ